MGRIAGLILIALISSARVAKSSEWHERYQAALDIETAFTARFGSTSIRTWSDDGRRIETFIGRSAVKEFLTDPSALVRRMEPFLLVPAANLRLKRRVDTATGSHFEYEQVIGAAVLENALLFFDIDSSGALVSLFNRTAPFPAPLIEAVISAASARCFAQAAVLNLNGSVDCLGDPTNVPVGDSKFEFAVEKIWYVEQGRAVEAYAVVISSLNPYVIRRYVVHGRTGAILEVRNRIQTFAGAGRIFNPNPFVKGAKPIHNTVTAAEYAPCALEGLHAPPTGSDYLLEGDWVKISDFYPQQIPEVMVTGTNGDFLFDRGGNRFASVMIYCHVDRMQRYVQSLNIGDIARRQIEADPRDGFAINNYNGEYENNAYGTGRLVFGFRSDPAAIYVAEDGDIIAHEYGHAIQAAQALEHYREPEGAAMSEGFADYWSFVFFENENAQLQEGCYGEWKCRAPGYGCETGCDRVVDLSRTHDDYDPDPTVDPHVNGAVWTATLWKIRKAFDRDTANKIILKSHWSVPDKPSFADGARAILTADGLLNHNQNYGTLCLILGRQQKMIKPEECEPLIGKLPPVP